MSRDKRGDRTQEVVGSIPISSTNIVIPFNAGRRAGVFVALSFVLMARKKETKRWPVQDAKARFSELLEASLTGGPQIVTRRGVEMAVLVRVDQWRQLEETTRPPLKDLLLSAGARAEISVPPRRNRRRRTPAAFE